MKGYINLKPLLNVLGNLRNLDQKVEKNVFLSGNWVKIMIITLKVCAGWVDIITWTPQYKMPPTLANYKLAGASNQQKTGSQNSLRHCKK